MAAPIQVSPSSDASLEQPAASALDSTHGQPSGPPWSVPLCALGIGHWSLNQTPGGLEFNNTSRAYGQIGHAQRRGGYYAGGRRNVKTPERVPEIAVQLRSTCPMFASFV